MYAFLSIPAAYLIGSISSSSIVGKFSSSFNPRSADDGRISAAAVYKNIGRLAFLITAAMDVGLAAATIIIARILNASMEVQVGTGVAAMLGHNWSIFLKFKGGLGATAIAGVLIMLVPLPFICGLVVAVILYATTRRAGLSTICAMIVTSSILFIQQEPPYLAAYPITLWIIMVLKRWQADGITALAHWDR
jgi:acyl phosphate:glycerol-3-phosphate acyltransferase